ncbi:MAG: DNA primase [Segatella salivae]|uniref:DNA primase n=1 Tax=Prevotella melaninogenica TaxID=28132 RepID=UPI0005C7354C|nr:DNA primase [Prevotella melaninogenica]ASE17303.1 DNA primase [Prevotella melaninogenica]UEB08560.1 DNA primase [Prevotella melaninogenica]
MIPKTIIEKILDAAHIEDVVGEFLPLQKRGTIYRALCPFHQEKTPSFTVTPNRSMFYCFGCHKGGNVITFLMEHENMTYPEAVRWLGRKYGIEVEEREETIDEKQQRLKRESLLIVNTAVHKHYREVFLRYKPAQDYAYRRWGQKYCDEIEIGFAPIDGKALAHLPLQKEFLQELGLINPQGYDFFQNRIVIPIKDRYQHIIGFTARVMDDSQPKYLNSKESLLYSKRSTVFGLDVAWRAAGKTGQMYLVEGAPDCMRLHAIGVQNAVADLGSAWTVEQFQLIKRAANKVCFIPDNDPLKGGADYGTGIEAVMKAGKLATEQHLTVSVKEITTTEEGKKEDPDTYFKNQTLFKAVEEEDFILWLAAKLFETSGNTEQKSDAVKRIAHLLSFIDDDTKLTMFIDALTKYHRGKLFWQKAIENERTRRDSPKEDDIDLNRQYGFWIDRGKYFSTTEKGGVLEWSNFTLTPLFHIKDPLMAKRLYLLTNELGVKEIVEMEQEDLISLQKFRQKLESLGNFIWKASEKELIKLKSFLYEKTETAAQIKQLGWNKKGFFAFGNGIFDGRQFHEVNEYGIVHLGEKGNFYLPALSRIYKENTDYFRFERQFVHFNFSMISLRDFTRQLFLVFGDNGKIGFCFYLATLFRDIITLTTRSFPILDLFGPKGSGKSELGHTLMSFFVIDNIPPNIQNSTIPALNDTVAAAANALVHIDEYKNGIDTAKIEFIKGLWDGTGRTRMNMATDKKKETTAVDAGVIISGQEMPTADIALFSRLIFLLFPKSNFTASEKANYQQLLQIRSKGLSHLTLQLLAHRDKFGQCFYDQYRQTLDDVNSRLTSHTIIDRIVQNWVIPLTSFRCLEGKLDTTLSYKELLEITVEGIVHQNMECKTNDELGSFWRMVQFLNSEGEINEDADFKIKAVSRFRSTLVSETVWTEPRKILYLQKTRIFMLYKLNAHRNGETSLPEESLRYYLENSKEYLGEQRMTYHVIKKGNQVLDFEHRDAKGQPTKMSVQQRSYCFDYEKLVEAFDINLEMSRNEDI